MTIGMTDSTDSTPITSTDLTVNVESNAEPNTTNNIDEPVVTNDSLKDVINWLKKGDLVVLFCRNLRLVYRITDKEPNRKITVELSGPSLLNEGEWPWYIKNAGATQQPNENGVFKSEHFFRLNTYC